MNRDSVVSQHLSGVNLNSSNYAAALQAYQNAPATGCATIINQVRVAQGYNPLSPAQDWSAYNAWIKGVIDSGLFTVAYQNAVPFTGVNSWQVFVSRIVQSYVGITSTDAARIQQSIMQLVQAAYTMPGRPESVHMVQQTIASNQDGSVSAYFYHTTVYIKYTEGDKNSSSVLESTITIDQVKLDMALSTWQAKAAEVANKQVSLVSSWLNNMTNAKTLGVSSRSLQKEDRASNDLSCFRKVPGRIDARANGNANDYWFAFDWSQLPEDARKSLLALGWNAENWMEPFKARPIVMEKGWDELNDTEKEAAENLSFTRELWDGPGVMAGIHSGKVRAYWRAFQWKEIAPVFQQKWSLLGWTELLWDNKTQSIINTGWEELSIEKKQAASWLGLTAADF